MKDRFYFSKRERLKLCFWAFVMLLALGGYALYLYIDSKDEVVLYQDSQNDPEVERFVRSVKEKEKQHFSKHHYEVVFRPHAFNPNTCDSVTLLNMGLKPWQVGTFLKYRKAGARFYKEEDLRRVYSFTAEDVDRMLPYVQFPVDERQVLRAKREREKQHRDSLYQAKKATYPVKMKAGEVIPLNASDTTALKKIPGVGSYYAYKIKRYGERLGGYISTSQLDEVGDLPADISKWFTLDKVKVKRLRINHDDFKTLLRHPYLNYEQVKAIFQHRQKYGKLTSLQQLSLESAFTATDMKRLEPYITFE